MSYIITGVYNVCVGTEVSVTLKHINTTRFYHNSPCVRDPRKTVILMMMMLVMVVIRMMTTLTILMMMTLVMLVMLVMQSIITDASDDSDDDDDGDSDDRLLFPFLLSVVISPYSSTCLLYTS